MTEEELVAQSKTMSRWERHRFLLLVFGTIVISLFLVGIAMALYSSSGTEALDLSRPGYKSIREKVKSSTTFDSFPSSGPLDQQALDKFRSLYVKQAEQATSIDSFGGKVMSDQALGIDDVPTGTASN